MPVNPSIRRMYRLKAKKSPCRGLAKKSCKRKTNCMRTRKTQKKRSYCRLSKKKSSAKMYKKNRYAVLANSKSTTSSN